MQPDNTHTKPEGYNGERIIVDDGYTMVTLCQSAGSQKVHNPIFMTTYKRRGYKDTWVMDSGIAVDQTEFKSMSERINKYIADHRL